jgi:hypothetical protein
MAPLFFYFETLYCINEPRCRTADSRPRAKLAAGLLPLSAAIRMRWFRSSHWKPAYASSAWKPGAVRLVVGSLASFVSDLTGASLPARASLCSEPGRLIGGRHHCRICLHLRSPRQVYGSPDPPKPLKKGRNPKFGLQYAWLIPPLLALKKSYHLDASKWRLGSAECENQVSVCRSTARPGNITFERAGSNCGQKVFG